MQDLQRLQGSLMITRGEGFAAPFRETYAAAPPAGPGVVVVVVVAEGPE